MGESPLQGDPVDIVDVKGKVVIVTGGNSGIGFTTVQHLARSGAKVYLGARDETRATEAIARLHEEGLGSNGGEVIWHKLNLSDPRDAKKSGEEFLEREKRLDVLISNAAMTVKPYGQSSDGISNSVVVNHISPFVLTKTLLPLLTRTAQEENSDVRIVNVSSAGHKLLFSSFDFKEIADFNPTFENNYLPAFSRYCHSKTMAILWIKSLQKRLDAANIPIVAVSIHPGSVDTFTQKWRFSRLSAWLMWCMFFVSPARGAYPSVYAAAGKEIVKNREKYKGAYLENRPLGQIGTPSKAAMNEELAERLWNLTEKFLQGIGL